MMQKSFGTILFIILNLLTFNLANAQMIYNEALAPIPTNKNKEPITIYLKKGEKTIVGSHNYGTLRPDNHITRTQYFTNQATNADCTHTGLSVVGGSGAFQILTDNCTGQTGGFGYTCSYSLEIGHEDEGVYQGQVNLTGIFDFYDPDRDNEEYLSEVTLRVVVGDTEVPPECPATGSGSILRIDNASVSETVDIIGTDFALYYSSEFASEYTGSVLMNKNSFFAPEMISVSAQHYYDKIKGRIYYGHGTSVEMAHTVLVGGNLSVVDSSGREIFVFDTNGKHLQTLNSLIGSTKYTFNYDVNNKLESIVDAFGNTTEILRDGSGVLIGIEAPFGQITDISVNGNGLVDSITNPNNEEYEFTYKTGTELLETFTDPNGIVNTFLITWKESLQKMKAPQVLRGQLQKLIYLMANNLKWPLSLELQQLTKIFLTIITGTEDVKFPRLDIR